MAKKQTFADKLKHTAQTNVCPVCGEVRQSTMVLAPAASAAGSLRLRQSRVAVCKCNRKQVYG
jgi:formate dehydrogenase maturation protein FdhE